MRAFVPDRGAAPAWRARRFRPGLWLTVAAAVVIAATVSLGNWQGRRAAYRGELQAQAERAAAEAPFALTSASAITPELRYRSARAEGRYMPHAQAWLDNRTHHGIPGYRILTPLELSDRTYVLVDRGWIAAGAQRGFRPDAPPPSGTVVVEGRLNTPPASFLELKHLPPANNVWQNLDLADYARTTGIGVAPLVLEQAPGTSDGLVREWAPPDLGRDTNLSYMWQWYAFAALALVFWAVLGWRRAA